MPVLPTVLRAVSGKGEIEVRPQDHYADGDVIAVECDKEYLVGIYRKLHGRERVTLGRKSLPLRRCTVLGLVRHVKMLTVLMSCLVCIVATDVLM